MGQAQVWDLHTITPVARKDEAPPRDANAAKASTAWGAVHAIDNETFEFTGTGAEYFRIWVVNLLLTILTLGVYSAWAKVRRMQYIYRNTRVAGAIFDYHGRPQTILKGRILALLLVGAFSLARQVYPPAALCIGAILFLITPWLLARSFRFKLHNSSYRGLRFRFSGSTGDAYRMLSLFPILLVLCIFFGWITITSFIANPNIDSSRSNSMAWVFLASFFGRPTGWIFLASVLGLLASLPWTHYCLKRYQHNHAYFGQSPVFFHARAREFLTIYAKALGLFVLSLFPVGIIQKLLVAVQSSLPGLLASLVGMAIGMLSSYLLFLFLRPFLESRLQNLVWNNTELGGNTFFSQTSARRLVWIHASNLLLTVFTLGLYQPFATMRLLKYRIESMRLIPDSDLEEFLVSHAGDNAGALGQEAADFFDIDIAL